MQVQKSLFRDINGTFMVEALQKYASFKYPPDVEFKSLILNLGNSATLRNSEILNELGISEPSNINLKSIKRLQKF
jgi:hypothetical protein